MQPADAPERAGRQVGRKVLTLVLGLQFVVLGVWAFFGPVSFYDNVATFEPYNLHLLHDVGAFQLGIGAAVLAALRWRDGLLTALAGGTCTGTRTPIRVIAIRATAGAERRRTNPLGGHRRALVVPVLPPCFAALGPRYTDMYHSSSALLGSSLRLRQCFRTGHTGCCGRA